MSFLHHPSIIALLKPLLSLRHDTGVHSALTVHVDSMKPLPSLSHTLCCDSDYVTYYGTPYLYHLNDLWYDG